jgi:hypothetical protein
LNLSGIYAQNQFSLANDTDDNTAPHGTDVNFNYVSFSNGTINNNGPYTPQITNGGSALELTNGNQSEAASWFATTPYSIAGFTASFDYKAAGASPADGMAFILQNSSAGVHALGGDGSSLGYGALANTGGTVISPSAAVEFNVYSGHPPGTAFATNGGTGNYHSTGNVAFWNGDQIQAVISYNGSVLTETLTDLVNGATYTANYTVDLASVLGSKTAYVGFSAATGGGTSTQTVSNFTFAEVPVVTASGPTSPTFTTIDVPGATYTLAMGINNAGHIVGQDSTSGHEFGWQYDGSSFHPIQHGSAHNTSAGAINDSGLVAGYFEPVSSTPRYGFTLTGSTFTTIDHSPFSGGSTTSDGINNAGVITGAIYLGGNSYEGYIDKNGAVTILQDPASASSITRPNGINNAGDVVGSYDNRHGFIYHNGVYTTIDDPNGVNGTWAQGINDHGQIVGYYKDGNNVQHGFIDSGGIFTTIDDPLGVHGTAVTGINNSDQVVGYYTDANNVQHGFEATLNATSTAENAPLVLTSLNVSDPAAGTNPIQVTLAVGHGTLALNNATGVTASFDANHDALTITGSVTAIDAAMAKGVVYTPANGFIGDDTLTVTANDQGHNSSGIAQSNMQTLDIPVTQPLAIATDHFIVTHNSNGITTIAGLSVLDADASPTETFTISAVTSGAGTSTVTPALSSPDSGSLTHINGDLATNGITYNPGLSPSPIDNVKVTVTDSFGATDTVNFIFNVAQNPSQPVTLTSTTGKDVMFGTGYQDQFVFAANSNNDKIMNFTPGQDHIDLTALSATVNASNLNPWFASHVAASPVNSSDTLITLDAADTILLHNVTVTQLHSSDFIVHA